MTYRIELKDISKYFGEVRALHDVNFKLGQNEVVGLLGDNGAGKSNVPEPMDATPRPHRPKW